MILMEDGIGDSDPQLIWTWKASTTRGERGRSGRRGGSEEVNCFIIPWGLSDLDQSRGSDSRRGSILRSSDAESALLIQLGASSCLLNRSPGALSERCVYKVCACLVRVSIQDWALVYYCFRIKVVQLWYFDFEPTWDVWQIVILYSQDDREERSNRRR